MSADPASLFILWLLTQGKPPGAKPGPAWPTPRPAPRTTPRTTPGTTPGTTPADTPADTPAPRVASLLALPDASWKPHPKPIPGHVREVAQNMLRAVPRGQWRQEGEVIYRHEPHAPGRWGITAYVSRR
jgi:hypothetical protein